MTFVNSLTAMIYYDAMEIDFASPEQIEPRPLRRRRSWLEFTLLLGFVLCILIGIGALGVLTWFSTSTIADVARSPLDTLRTERVVPSLALMELAGDPPQALAFQAINGGYLDTAHASLLFDTDIGPDATCAIASAIGPALSKCWRTGASGPCLPTGPCTCDFSA